MGHPEMIVWAVNLPKFYESSVLPCLEELLWRTLKFGDYLKDNVCYQSSVKLIDHVIWRLIYAIFVRLQQTIF
jgi:hypothetical protein